MSAPVWNLKQAVAIARLAEPIAQEYGFHAALGGSCLHLGSSAKDVDIILFPHRRGEERPTADVLNALGSGMGISCIERAVWRYSNDTKEVYRTYCHGRRVDFIFCK